MSQVCIVEGCDGEISDRSSSKVCATCRAGVYRWMKRKPSEIMNRRRNLTKYSTRLGMVTGENFIDPLPKQTPRKVSRADFKAKVSK